MMKTKTKAYILMIATALLLAGCGGGSPTDSDDGDGNDGGDPVNTTAPAAPVGLEGTSGDQQVELIWEANSESDLDGYNLYRSTSSFSDISGMSPVNGGSLIGMANFTDTGLQNGTTYYYRVTAVDESDNESGISGELEITPFDDPPDRPKQF